MLNKFNLGFVAVLMVVLVPCYAQAEEMDVVAAQDVMVAQDVVQDTIDADVVDESEFIEEVVPEMTPDEMSAAAVSAYDVTGSLFQQITDLEQEKVLMQLEKERAQLDLDLDRLAAEKIKLHMEIDTLSGRAEQQQQELDAAIAELEAQTAKLEQEKANMATQAQTATAPVAASGAARGVVADETPMSVNISENYRLVNVFGAGNQLQATVMDLVTGQSKRISVGKKLAGLTVESISVDDGIEFSGPNGEVQTLNISNE